MAHAGARTLVAVERLVEAGGDALAPPPFRREEARPARAGRGARA